MARVKPLIAVAVVAAAVAFGAPAHAVALKWVHRCAYIRAPGFGRLGIYPDRVTCAEGAFITYRTFIEPGTPTPCCSASHYRDGWWCGGHMGAYFCYYPYDRKPTTRAVYAWQCRTTGCPPRILAVRLPAKTLARRNRARPPNTMRATPARAGTAAPSRLKPVQRCAYIRVPVFGRLGIYPDEVTCPEAAFLIYRAFTDRGAPTPCCTGSHWPDGWWCGAGHAASYLCYHPYSRNPYTHAPTTGAVYAYQCDAAPGGCPRSVAGLRLPYGKAEPTVRVIRCPTTFGDPTEARKTPSTLAVLDDPASTRGLVAYTNTHIYLIGPAGMQCSGGVGEDGTTALAVGPRGLTRELNEGGNRYSGAGLTLAFAPDCVACESGAVCPFFPHLARALGWPCTTRIPRKEQARKLTRRVTLFEDPPGIRGDGWPSGGPDVAHGVVGFTGSIANGNTMVYRSTCTLPASERWICTVSLNDVLSRYG